MGAAPASRHAATVNPRTRSQAVIRTGDTLENPVTGERMRFLKTSRDTDGAAVVVELTLQPHGTVAAAHVHPLQVEQFRIMEGTIGFRLGRKRLEARPGDTVVVDRNTAHKFWNAGDTPARFIAVVRPALQFERLIETMFSLAADGRTNGKGMPNPLRLAVIAKAHFDDVRLPFPPAPLQRFGLAVGAPLGRLFGYEPTYESTAAPAPALAEV
jgi:quercetin dioxygenase-like cupin family protein